MCADFACCLVANTCKEELLVYSILIEGFIFFIWEFSLAPEKVMFKWESLVKLVVREQVEIKV